MVPIPYNTPLDRERVKKHKRGSESFSFKLVSLRNNFAPNQWQLQPEWKPTPEPKMALLCFLLDLRTLPPPILTGLADVRTLWIQIRVTFHFPSLSGWRISRFFVSCSSVSLCCSSPISMPFHHHHPLLESACATSSRTPPLFLMMLLYGYAKTFIHTHTHTQR